MGADHLNPGIHMKKIIGEPLVQFVLLGLALALVLSLAPDSGRPRDDQIVVTAEKIDHLAGLFTMTWKRPPTPRELDGLVRDHVREELAYREGLAMGMERDDTIIRRRIRQKMEFIAEDLGMQIKPTDEELQEYLTANAERFELDPSFDFRQIYFSAERRPATADADARAVLTELKAGRADAAEVGDGGFFRHGYSNLNLRDVANVFGSEFAAQLTELEPGSWQGPVVSGYGLHLVQIDKRIPGRQPALDEIRGEVLREWEYFKRDEALDLFYGQLESRYEIIVEWDKILEGAES